MEIDARGLRVREPDAERASAFRYELPEELIAQVPLEDRAASRLLVLDRRSGAVAHRGFRDVVELLEPGDLLVLNDTRVTAVRLTGRKETGGAVEALLMHELEPGLFEAMLKPAKRVRVGSFIDFGEGLVAEVAGGDAALRLLRFKAQEGLQERLEKVGSVPLPPYIHESLRDRERYQTVYASHGGSAAAPTAGLHFTPEILEALKGKGVEVATVTLDVSIDTFRPMQVENLDEHVMHGEKCRISEEAAGKINTAKGRIIAVGTTSVRTLETMAAGKRQVRAGETTSKLFIRPDFEFQVVDAMFTNFHLPGTTMMLMISAMAGRENVLRAYEEAVRERYRFLSFGDSMLII